MKFMLICVTIWSLGSKDRVPNVDTAKVKAFPTLAACEQYKKELGITNPRGAVSMQRQCIPTTQQ